MTSPSALEWTSQFMTGLPLPGQLLTLPIPLSHPCESTNPTWGLCSLQAPLTGGKLMGNEGAFALEPLDLELKLMLPLVVAAVPLDLGIQPPVVEFPGVGHQVMEPLSGAHEEPVVPYQHGLDWLIDDLSGGGIEGGDVHVLICILTCEEVSLAVIAMAHPLGLHLEAIGDGDEGCDLTLIGLKIVGTHGFILMLVLCKLSTDLIEAFLSGIDLPLEVLDLLSMVFVMLVKGLKEAIDEAPQVFRGHLKDSQRSGRGSWGEGEREVGGILGFFDRWWYR